MRCEGPADSPPPPSTPHPYCPAAQAWSVLAPLLAGRPRVRESRGNGHSYLRRWERPLTTRLPSAPAAVPIYSSAGDTRVLVIDLDASRGGVAVVRRDAAAVAALVHSAGGKVITDESPSGGMHVYMPLEQPVGFHDARDLALALAARTPSMDPTPNQNLTDGLPPGRTGMIGGLSTFMYSDITQLYRTYVRVMLLVGSKCHRRLRRGRLDRSGPAGFR